MREPGAPVAPAGCVACGRVAARPLYDVNGFAIVACACGLARTVLPPGFDPASIYTEDYFHGGHPDGYADYTASGEELRHEFRRILAALRTHVPGGALVEIGCAYGFFLDEAAAHFRTLGVEISDHAREVCLGRGLAAIPAATPEALAARGPFDAAVMLDVLEHMPDPGTTLDVLHGAMRPGGQLVLSTGDFASAIARGMGKHWRLMTPPQHLWFFSPATVTALLRRHGFRVHTVEHPWKLVPVALALYQASRYVGGQDLVRRLMPPGRIPVNLFDAMRVIATHVPDDDAGYLRPYALAARHARGRVLDLGCGLGGGTRLLAASATAVVGVEGDPAVYARATARPAASNARFDATAPTAFHDPDGFDQVVVLDPLGGITDLDLVIVRALAALRPTGLLVTAPAAQPLAARYGLVEVDRDDASIAWRRA